MKRIHYLLLGLLVSFTIAAVSPTQPPTRIAPGSNVTVVTNGFNSFTISSSGGGGSGILTSNGLGTNTTFYSSGTTNRSIRLYDTNGTEKVWVDKDGIIGVESHFTITNLAKIAYDVVFAGYRAGAANGGGFQNVGIGQDALNTSRSSYSSAVGAYALSHHVSGDGNAAFGQGSLFSHATGDNNQSFGRYSLYYNITGSRNVALGFSAGNYEMGSDSFYVNNRDWANTTSEKVSSLLYGTFNDAPASQTLRVNGALSVISGSSSTYAKVGGTLFAQTTTNSTTSTTGPEDNLYSITLAANVFSADLQTVIQQEHAKRIGGVTKTGRIKKYFGGTNIFDSGDLSLNAGEDFSISTRITRHSSTVAMVTVTVSTTSASTIPYVTATTVTLSGLAFTTTQILKTTGIASGTGAAAADITNDRVYGQWFPAP